MKHICNLCRKAFKSDRGVNIHKAFKHVEDHEDTTIKLDNNLYNDIDEALQNNITISYLNSITITRNKRK